MAVQWESRVRDIDSNYEKVEDRGLLKAIIINDDSTTLNAALDAGLRISKRFVIEDDGEVLPVEFYAIKRTALKCLKLLVDERQNMIARLRDADKRNILFYAVCNGFTGIKLISLLVAADKRYNLQLFYFTDAQRNTVLHVLVHQKASISVVELVARTCPRLVVHMNDAGLSPLHLACKFDWALGVFTVFLGLIRNIINVDFSADEGVTCLHYAALNGSLECVRGLLQHGATQTTMYDDGGDLPIHIAARHGHNEIVVLLMETNSTCIYATNRYNETALSIAVVTNNVELFDTFLEKDRGIVEYVDSHGFSLLHHAVVGNAATIVPRLILENSDLLDSVDINGRSPIYLAVLKNKASVLDAILKASSLSIRQVKRNEFAMLMCALRVDAHEAFEVLCRHDVDLKKRLFNGDTILHAYVVLPNCREESLNLLVSQCEDLVHIRNNNGLLAQDLVAYGGLIYQFLQEISSRPMKTPCDDDVDE